MTTLLVSPSELKTGLDWTKMNTMLKAKRRSPRSMNTLYSCLKSSHCIWPGFRRLRKRRESKRSLIQRICLRGWSSLMKYRNRLFARGNYSRTMKCLMWIRSGWCLILGVNNIFSPLLSLTLIITVRRERAGNDWRITAIRSSCLRNAIWCWLSL